jgi:hypothetical protein
VAPSGYVYGAQAACQISQPHGAKQPDGMAAELARVVHYVLPTPASPRVPPGPGRQGGALDVHGTAAVTVDAVVAIADSMSDGPAANSTVRSPSSVVAVVAAASAAAVGNPSPASLANLVCPGSRERPHSAGLSSRRAWELACVPGVEGHACPGVSRPVGAAMGSMPHANRRHRQASRQSINACNQHGKTSTARRAGGRVHVNPRHRGLTPEQHLLTGG